MTHVFLEFDVNYDEDINYFVINAGAGCAACTDSTQLGHFACSSSPDELLEAEEEDLCTRIYINNNWIWVLTFAGENLCCLGQSN